MADLVWSITDEAGIEVQAAAEHLRWYYAEAPHAKTYLWQKTPHGNTTWSGTADELAERLEANPVAAQDLVLGGSALYYGLGACDRLMGRRERPRRNSGDVVWLPAVFADIDLKPGRAGFATVEQIVALRERLRELGLHPDAVVGTGTGGEHWHWRVRGGMTPATFREAVRRMLAWIEHETGVVPDQVSDPERIARVPGTVRWRKDGEPEDAPPWTPVTVLHRDDGWTDLALLWKVTQGAWEAHHEALRVARRSWKAEEARVASGRSAAALAAQAELDAGAEPTWARLAAAYSGDDDAPDRLEVFTRTVGWSAVLAPKGWQVSEEPSPGTEGRTYWQRPRAGAGDAPNPRSASTGLGEDPDAAMSLLSVSVETGLRPLVDQRKKLTKVRVAAQLWAGGSLSRLLDAWEAAGRPSELDGIEGLA